MARGETLMENSRILAIQSRNQLPPVKRIVFTAELTYTGIDPPKIPPAEVILVNMAKTKTEEVSCLRFKEWDQGRRRIGIRNGDSSPSSSS